MQIEFYQDKSGEWRWRSVAANGNILATSSEGYANRLDCEGGLVALALALRGNARVVEIGADGGTSTGHLTALIGQHAAARA